MRMVDVDTLERITRDIFVAWKAPREDASWIASLLVRANLRGHDSHGVIRIPHYVHALKTGDVNPTPSIKTEMETPTIARLDGDKGFGQVVARHGITLAIAKAGRRASRPSRSAARTTSDDSPTTRRWRRSRG
jgi:LDH2 family malate/lactate/ureidoglycolate dehydrogenase